jgi:hypothetical protein
MKILTLHSSKDLFKDTTGANGPVFLHRRGREEDFLTK